MDGGGETLICFVVTCRDPPELLEPLEAVLDEVSPLVVNPTGKQIREDVNGCC